MLFRSNVRSEPSRVEAFDLPEHLGLHRSTAIHHSRRYRWLFIALARRQTEYRYNEMVVRDEFNVDSMKTANPSD